jgi:hypothetical protein
MFTKPKLLIAFLFLFLMGCANTEGLETQIKMLRTEMQTQLETQNKMLRSDMQTQNQSLSQKIADLKTTHEKDTKEIQTSIIDLQKDFLANKRVVEDTARRTYLLEMLMTARRATPSEQREGYITYVKEKQVAISLGGESGVRTGDLFEIFKGGSGKKQIASIRILSVEAESAVGEIVSQTDTISIGDRVDKKR